MARTAIFQHVVVQADRRIELTAPRACAKETKLTSFY